MKLKTNKRNTAHKKIPNEKKTTPHIKVDSLSSPLWNKYSTILPSGTDEL